MNIKTGMSALDANPLYKGRSYEQSSCVSGLDEIKHPGRKLLPVDSKFYLTLEGPDAGKKIEAIVAATPLDDNDHAAATSANPSRQAHYEGGPLLLPLPAGRYRVFASPRGDYSGYREPSFVFTLKKGQSLRKTLKLRSTASVAQGEGTLRLVGASRENPVSYIFVSAIDSNGVSITKTLPKSKVVSATRDFPLSSGTYLLRLQPQNYAGGEQRAVVSVWPGKVTTQKIIFQQAGQLSIGVNGLFADQKVGLSIWTPDNHRLAVLSVDPQRSPLNVTLAPGQYEAKVYALNNGPIYGPTREARLDHLVVPAGGSIESQVTLPAAGWGILHFNALLEGQPLTASVEIVSAKSPNERVFPVSRRRASVRMPLEVKLLEGDYRLSIWGEEPRDKRQSIFPRPRFAQTGMALSIKEGQTFTKTLKFKKQVPAKLTLTVLLNGSAVKARIKGRKAGSRDPFSPVGATYNFFSNGIQILPGTYDLSVQPLELHLALGIDVFQGRKGQLINPRPAKGTKPMILHNVEIKLGSSASRTLRFESSE
ncbi:MAG: hypothetical protein GXP51_11820 [Deltaproteobacteria bacterium]|nr:hypothetical protein [Deltaproteobacteria bacterium]